MRTCVAKNSGHLMHAEGVDTSRSVRDNDVCVRIIVGESSSNVTHDFPRAEPREGDVKRGTAPGGRVWERVGEIRRTQAAVPAN